VEGRWGGDTVTVWLTSDAAAELGMLAEESIPPGA
jgi:hypothetical protein